MFITESKLSSKAKYILIYLYIYIYKYIYIYIYIKLFIVPYKRNITCGCCQPQNTTTINYTWVLADVLFYTLMWRHIKTWKMKCSFSYKNCSNPDLVSVLWPHKHSSLWYCPLKPLSSNTWSVRKVCDLWPGKRNWLTWSVGHLLKVVPLGLHTLLPAVPPLLEACRKSLFRNGV